MRPLVHLSQREPHRTGSRPNKKILGDRAAKQQGLISVCAANAVIFCLLGRRKTQLTPVQLQLTSIQRVNTGHDVDQRRLPLAVLSTNAWTRPALE